MKLQKCNFEIIYKNLEGCTAQTLGFKKDSFDGKWKVDHCNGRSSSLGQFINDQALALAKKNTEKVMSPELISKIIKECEKGIRDELKDRYKRNLENEVWSVLSKQIKADAEAIVNRYKSESVLSFTVPTVADLSDPNVCFA